MIGSLATIAIASGYLMARFAERRVHLSNYDFLTFAGAEELIPGLMRAYYQWSLLILPLALAEHLVFARSSQPVVQLVGINLVVIGLLLRVWAINALGRLWTMRCLFVAGMPKTGDGPFRLVAHPEYLSRLMDGLGLCLFFNAYLTGPLFVMGNLYFFLRIVKVEKRQLTELALF